MNESKDSEFEKLSIKFLNLSVREQVMILVAGVVLILLLMYTLLLEPTFDETKKLKTNIASVKSELTTIDSQSAALMAQLQIDPNVSIRKRIAQINEQIASLDETLHSKISNLVPANQMGQVLESVLASSKGIKLVSLESITPTPLYLKSAAEDEQQVEPDLFRHGVNITLEGKYFEIQAYLEKLESLKWKFYWQKFDYKVEQYPIGQLELEIYTVSTSRAFIGV
ncbi:type II secretion system protein GspM [Paraglaciecola aquimarina]|uniref:Type II secretion system protein GspM n=1 Tax=Paraglaciecola aquimarina TaxID=1235557 RepID=A0ABU3SSZ0_9ALTE|nr:type II secretion system protein GspM [Paraglaciecola aquimarina]MDU0353129.1 type II secretion system protein GspM [Paraglaciecola aquimarina]